MEDSTLPLLLLLQLVSDDRKILSFQTRCQWNGSHVHMSSKGQVHGSLVLSYFSFHSRRSSFQYFYGSDILKCCLDGWNTYPEVSCGRGRSCDKFDAFILLCTDLVFCYYFCDFFVTTSISLYGGNTVVPPERFTFKKSLSHHHNIMLSDIITVSIINAS